MICIVGDILNDITLATANSGLKMRLGGIAHAARGLWAIGVEYAVAYFAPSYLDSHIESYLNKFDCKQIIKLGNVVNCPYTMLVNEVKEVGSQGYEFLLHDNIIIDYDQTALSSLNGFDELIVISGSYNLHYLTSCISSEIKIHCDVANNVKDLSCLIYDRKVDTLFLSTSSDLFRSVISDKDCLFETLARYANNIVLKENRGGSRIYETSTNKIYSISSQTSPIQHSVGVGDVYDVVCVTAPYANIEDRAYYASWVAKEYASTTFPVDFKKAVMSLLHIPVDQLKRCVGCFLPWEVRQKCHIYIAGPDFDFVDTRQIDILCECLKYHNFVPHRPIVENGQMSAKPDQKERSRLFSADMTLYEKCNMMIAVLLYNDPGTLIEIGLAAQRGMPMLVYDPFHIADNCMLTELPTLLSSDMDVIMSRVFNEYSKMYANGAL